MPDGFSYSFSFIIAMNFRNAGDACAMDVMQYPSVLEQLAENFLHVVLCGRHFACNSGRMEMPKFEATMATAPLSLAT